MKKRIAALLAIAMTLSLFPSVSMADDPTASTTEPEVTVVGKRITDGDPYFEISLEVNGDYADYSSVGVVLEYDPTVIVPAASWDEGAGQADMKDNDSWATRRALPTLGKDTWSSHIALAYQTAAVYDTDGTTLLTPAKGYLYLGAEYPGETPSTAEPAAAGDSGSGDSGSGDGGTTPTDTETPADPYTNPVVVARFMYASPTKYASGTAEEITAERAATKTALETAWTTGNWDDDWTINKILTIAPDDIALESPAQFPFAYYGADFSERAYMKTFPTPAPTTGVTATPAAVHTVFASGSRIAEADRLTKDDIEIVLGQGASAKLTGGISLNDVYSIVFFDWDDSILGILTAAVGVDMTTDVDNYVQSKFVHPDLRDENHGGTIDYADYAPDVWTEDWLAREYSYRGVYPYSGPVAPPGGKVTDPYPAHEDSREDGEKYPLTNKLDYSFAGKGIDPTHPFANGWVQVYNDEIDWHEIQDNDWDALPGEQVDYMPHNFENTWTALDYGQTAGRMYFDENGDLDWDYEYADYYDLRCLDFKEVTSDSLSYTDGNLYVKAAYIANENLHYGNDDNYIAVGPWKIKTIGPVSAQSTTLSVTYQYRRINEFGYGVTRIRKPAINFSVKQVGSNGTLPLKLELQNNELIEVELNPTNNVDYGIYGMRELYGSDIVMGATRSLEDALGALNMQGSSGLLFSFNIKTVTESAVENKNVGMSAMWLDYTLLNSLLLSRDQYGGDFRDGFDAYDLQQSLINLVQECIDNNVDYTQLTWHQLQWGLLKDQIDPSLDYYYDADTAYNNFFDYGLEGLLDKADMW